VRDTLGERIETIAAYDIPSLPVDLSDAADGEPVDASLVYVSEAVIVAVTGNGRAVAYDFVVERELWSFQLPVSKPDRTGLSVAPLLARSSDGTAVAVLGREFLAVLDAQVGIPIGPVLNLASNGEGEPVGSGADTGGDREHIELEDSEDTTCGVEGDDQCVSIGSLMGWVEDRVLAEKGGYFSYRRSLTATQSEQGFTAKIGLKQYEWRLAPPLDEGPLSTKCRTGWEVVDWSVRRFDPLAAGTARGPMKRADLEC